jgi:AcrR family transcriptional regulator
MGSRMSAGERRESVLAAALTEFARGGLAGTSTEAIAVRAGISQPYLFRLFGTKKELFIAAMRRCFDHIEARFLAAAAGLAGDGALDAMARSYHEMLADRTLLLSQLHGYAASSDPEVQAAVRDCYGHLWHTVEAASGADPKTMQVFFAMGMLWNVAVALDLPDVGEPWAKAIMDESSMRTGADLAPAQQGGQV